MPKPKKAPPIGVTGRDPKTDAPVVLYTPLPHQIAFHEATAPNVLSLGPRGTGKSLMLRMHAVMKCLKYPNYHALILRRTMPELRRSHLVDIGYEMKMLGGRYRQNTFDARFPNGSTITFGHCEDDTAILAYLSSQYGTIIFDELSTFMLQQVLQISASARVTTAAPYLAEVRAGTNPLGPGAGWIKQWFVDHDVNLGDYPDYNPDDYLTLRSVLADNPYLDKEKYQKVLRNQPAHVRKAWLDGEFVIEGTYFADFMPRKRVGDEDVDWHCIVTLPTWQHDSLTSQRWLNIYRSIDWGYDPDPCVVMWHVVFPNGHKITFRERKWLRTLAGDVAKDVKALSSGMQIVETFADPSMFVKRGDSPYSIAEIFEMNGVPLTPSQANRELYGYALHEILDREIDGHPEWQIVAPECPNLVRTMPLVQMDPVDPRKLAHGEDHYVECAAYFAIGKAQPNKNAATPARPLWTLPRRAHNRMVAASLVR